MSPSTNQYHSKLTQYHQEPTSAAVNWPSATEWQPILPCTDQKHTSHFGSIFWTWKMVGDGKNATSVFTFAFCITIHIRGQGPGLPVFFYANSRRFQGGVLKKTGRGQVGYKCWKKYFWIHLIYSQLFPGIFCISCSSGILGRPVLFGLPEILGNTP